MSEIPFYNNGRLLVLACLTLGLTPFVPEPHIVGKIRWIAGGADGMQLMDWLDVAMHGTPWVLLLSWVLRKFIFKTINTQPSK